MNSFFAFLWFIANVVMIVFIVMAIREKDVEQKKQKRKIWLICLAVAVVSFIVFAATLDSSTDKKEQKIEANMEETAEVDESSEDATIEEESEDASVTSNDADAIELVAGELGTYGKEVVMSEGTEFEEHLIVYYLPAGKYTVKNLGEYKTQVSVYEGFEKNTETGYDEYTNTGDIVLLDVDGTDEIEVPDGWFIEIHEPTHISLTAK